METFYINGYRIAARTYAQALAAYEQLQSRNVPRNWPGEQDEVQEVAKYA